MNGIDPKKPCPAPTRPRRRGACLGLFLLGAVLAAAEPRVRIGVENNPASTLSSVDEKGQPVGFTNELLREMSRVSGIEFEIVPASWSSILAEFQAGRLDALANVTVTDERRAFMDFSITHANLHSVVYFRPDRPAIRRTADLAGKKISVLAGTVEYLNAARHQGWGGTIVPASNRSELFATVVRGECDVVLVTRRLNEKSVTELGLRNEFLEDVVHQYRIAVHKGDSATLARLNDALATVRQNGSFDRIYDRWVGPIEPHPIRLADLRPYFVPAALALLAVVVVIGWQRRMLAQRARQAAALRETEERYRGLVESAFDGSVIHQAGVVRTVNSAFAAMFGYTPDELIGRTVLDLSPPEVRDEIARIIASDRRTPYETVGLRKDGTRIEIETAGQACTYQGKPARIVAVRDITERKRAGDAIRRLNRELEERVDARTAELGLRVTEVERLNQELEAFSYSVSHDLRAPLRNITGFVELLTRRLEGKLDAESSRFVGTVKSEAKRMGTLIDDLLALSRVGRAELVKREVALDELVAEARAALQPEIGPRAIEWKVGPLPRVLGDRALLLLALNNLLGNAVKFTRRRAAAAIEIGALPADGGGGFVTIFVRDNGAGFNPKYADKLFGVFQRLHNQRDFEGTGIGLANVKRIVTRHDGQVWAEGSVDNGAVFYLKLKVYPS